MAEQQTVPGPAGPIRVSRIVCDWQAGPLRCVARLAAGDGSTGVKAIWRNEVGLATCTPPRNRNKARLQ